MTRPPLGRLVAILCVMVLALGLIVVRLGVLQVGQGAKLESRAIEQRVQTVALPAERGAILDRNGEQLALSMPARDIYADPRYVTDPWATATRLAPALGVDLAELVEKLTADTTFVYITRQAGLDLAREVQSLELPGIGFLPASRRSYPAGALAPQVLGFVGIDGIGLAGLELEYQDLLSGRPGERTQEFDPKGQPIAGGIDLERAPVPGSTVVTTIDREFQYQAQAALQEAVETNQARGGTVIVMDPRTGDVYAMASYPWFDPNHFEEAKPGVFRNRAITDAFEPGSVNKVITAAAAVEERALPLDQRLSVPWVTRVGGYTIHDSHPHAVQRMTLGDIVAQSSNVGAVQVAQRLGQSEMASYLSLFGLGRETGIRFPGESSGLMLPLYEWTDSSLATMAYGQGIAVTPLQMISVFSTIANGGRWVQPRLVRGTIDPEGSFHSTPASPARRVVSPETARTIAAMLAYAVDSGTGTNARIAGYQVAGKTGTARIPYPDRLGYIPGEYIASFIGFLPASGPRVVIAGFLDRPVTEYGGIAAAPLFRQIARYAITHLGIEPGEPLGLPPHALPVR